MRTSEVESIGRRLGTGSAIAILMTILILIVAVVIVRLGERGSEERTG